MTKSPIALITGANKGIGYETARRLAAAGWTIWLGARDPELGRQAAATLAGPGTVRPVPLDVTDDGSVAAAAKEVDSVSGRLDVLINNAGIGGSRSAPAETVPAEFLPVFGVNVLGPVRVTQAFLPLLRSGHAPRVIMVSSGMGSFGITTDPERFESTLHGLVYPSSKACLNMITSQYARALPEITFTAVDPGYTATDLNGHRGFQTVEQGATVVVDTALAVHDHPSGTFRDAAGPLPW
jgi:NAD(P)-dependent dehydrogenase (short-subunit alcohol dehydrogenase family)